MTSLACRTLVQCRSDDVTVGEAAKVSATAPVDRRVTDDPLLPIRRHKSRHAAVPATGTDDTVTATDVAAVCMEPVPVHWFTRQACSESKDHRYEAVRDTIGLSAVSSLSTRRCASMGHLPQQAVASASLYSSNDVTVTSSAPVAATEHVDVTSRDELSKCESREYRTTSLYSEPTSTRRGRHETRTTTRHRPSGGSAGQTNTRPTVSQQRADNLDSSSSSSSDNYESVDYIDNQSYSQQPSKHHVCIRICSHEVDRLYLYGKYSFSILDICKQNCPQIGK